MCRSLARKVGTVQNGAPTKALGRKLCLVHIVKAVHWLGIACMTSTRKHGKDEWPAVNLNCFTEQERPVAVKF